MGWKIIAVLAFTSAIVAAEDTCLYSDEEPYLYFGSKTAYVFASKGIPVNRIHDVVGCEPIAFWLLNRHGSHNPEANEIPELQKLADLRDNIVANYKNGNFRNTNQRICQADLDILEKWQWNPRQNLTFAGAITSEGYLNTQSMAQAWRQRFPGLLTENKADYLFKFVNDKRSDDTYRAFIDGLFRAQAEGYDISKENDEKLLKPYNHCPAWKRKVEVSNDTLSQMKIFQSKQEYKEMISNISLRLGFNYDINTESVMNMYQMCRYNKAWDVAQISPWCAVFTKEDLKRLEYAEDLETYYKFGYGFPETRQIGCTMVKDMMTFFENQVKNEIPQSPKAMIHFVESPMLLMTLAAMGTRHDSAPLTGDNYHTKPVQSRKWTTSTMSPFSANIAAVLYKCNTNGNFQVTDRYQVLFLENEKEMYLEGCRVGLCDWRYVKNRFGDIANNCDLKFCNGAANLNSVAALSLAILSFAVYVLS